MFILATNVVASRPAKLEFQPLMPIRNCDQDKFDKAGFSQTSKDTSGGQKRGIYKQMMKIENIIKQETKHKQPV